MESDPAFGVPEDNPGSVRFDKGFLARLTDGLHSLDTPPSSLPVFGYQPGGDDWQPRPAAVLVPIIAGHEPGILLTVRSQELPHHAGQVAFPGGGRSFPGESPVQTALREAREEVGLDGGRIQVIGLLDRFDTISAFRVVPVVALVQPPKEYRLDPSEVSEIFTVPFARIMDADSYQEHQVEFQGRSHSVLSLRECHPLVWGATAAILHLLCQRVNGAAGQRHDSD